MPELPLARWMLAHLSRTPWVLACALLLGVVPLQTALSPLPGPSLAVLQACRWAPAATSLGVLAGLVALSGIGGFLARLGPAARWRAELAALLTAGLYLLLPTMAGALLAGSGPSELLPWVPAILTRLLHLASLAFVLLHPSLAPTPRVALFVAAAWLLPALGERFALAAPFLALVDVQAPLGPQPDSDLGSALAAALALLLAGLLVRRVRASDES